VSDFTYHPPEFRAFLATIRAALEGEGKRDIAALLDGAVGEFYCSDQFSHRRWHGYDAEVRLRVPAERLPKFNPGVRAKLLEVAEAIMPPEVGYDLSAFSITPFMVGSGGEDRASQLPDMDAFLHSLRVLLEKNGHGDLVPLLLDVHATFSTRRNKVYLQLRVPLARIDSYSPSVLGRIADAGRTLLRSSGAGWLEAVEADPAIESPPDENAPRPRSTFKPAGMIEHDRLFFRSKTEIRVYEALKKRNVLFFVNATAVLGGKIDDKGNVLLREPDFLVCCEGRWGILEPGGDGAHTPQNAPRDHDRLRMFNDYGVTFHQFYPASRCYEAPEDVVNDFLARLARS
jgi:hypothetical protein